MRTVPLMSFSNDLIVRKYQYQMFLVDHGVCEWEEVVDMSMCDMRAAIDNILPTVITTYSSTVAGGTTKRVAVLKAA